MVDAPGWVKNSRSMLHRYMDSQVRDVISGCDLLLWVVEPMRWLNEEDAIHDWVRQQEVPIAVLINKIDRMKDKKRLLLFMDQLRNQVDPAFILPVSARNGAGMNLLFDACWDLFPDPEPWQEMPALDSPAMQWVPDLIRSQAMERLHQELPYSIAVHVEGWRHEQEKSIIEACLWVRQPSHKAMVIGKGGRVIMAIGSAARRVMEENLDQRVDLFLRVKVKENWDNDPAAILAMESQGF